MKNLSVAIYDIVYENFELMTGEDLPFEKESVSYQVESNKNELNLAKASFLDKKSYLIIAYISLYGRYPEKTDFQFFENQRKLSDENWQQIILKHIVDTKQFLVSNRTLINPIYQTPLNRTLEISKVKIGIKQKLKSLLFRFFQQLPKGVKTKIKKFYFNFRGWEYK